MRKYITDFWKWSQSYSLIKHTLQNLWKEKTIGNVFLKQWRSILKTVFEKHFKESRTACFWTRFMDYDCCYYYLLLTVIAETNIWRCFLRGGLQSWYVVILQKYIGKKDTILRSFCWHFPLNLLHGFSDKFLLRSAIVLNLNDRFES